MRILTFSLPNNNLLSFLVTGDDGSVSLLHTAGEIWNEVWGHGNGTGPTSRAGSKVVSFPLPSGGHSVHSDLAAAVYFCLIPSRMTEEEEEGEEEMEEGEEEMEEGEEEMEEGEEEMEGR